VENRPKILLVDDDLDFITMNKAVLEHNNYQVIVAHNGKEGLEKAFAEKPDLIILDLMMESLDTGFAVARALKTNEATQKTPIIMLTAVTHETGFKFGLEGDEEREWIRADEYLDKPVKPVELLAKIQSYVG
jgi:CheY-like chemotaxis protein